MIKTEQVELAPVNTFEISCMTGISQEELELRYLGAKENGEVVIFTITTTVESHRRKKMDPVVCRECRDGKHVNCDGSALNLKTDEIVKCECTHG